jgi:hypothetical protein
MTPERLRDIANAGWTYKERYNDKDPAKGLLGIRLTNAAKIWDEGYSIQIFNRTTVTIAQKANATIDDHVSLTKDDGRDFLEWLRLAHPEVLPPEIWEKLPEGELETPAAPASSSDEARSALVQYLAPRFPEVFGPGSMAASGAPLEETVLTLFRVLESAPKQVAESSRLTMRTILYLETTAHENYKAANVALRRAHESVTIPGRLEAAKEAYGFLGAAWDARRRAVEMRVSYGFADNNAPKIPAGEFPESIEMAEAWKVIAGAMLEQGKTTDTETRIASPGLVFTSDHPKLKQIADESGASSGAAITPPPPGSPAPGRVLTETDVTPGMMVTIADPNHPRFNQLAEIYCRVGANRYALTFKGEVGAPQFNLSQLRSLT